MPGGRLVFACWQEVERNPWHVGTALRSLVPPPPVPAPGKSPVGPSRSETTSTCASSWSGGVSSVSSAAAHEIMVRARRAPSSTGRSSRSWGSRPTVNEAERLVESHLAQFAVGPDDYEYPLAFRVFEAVNG